MSARFACLAVSVAAGAMLVACESDGIGGAAQPPAAETAPAIDYAQVVESYNVRLKDVSRLRGQVVARIRYKDKDNQWREEQPEGLLQVVVPDRMALSLGKAGRRLFWFGCNAERYWWLDLQDEPTAWVGKRTTDGRTARQELGVNIAPWDLIRLIGVLRIDPAAAGAAEWSKDGSLIGLTTAIGGSEAESDRDGEADRDTARWTTGYQRVWMDPKDHFPVRIELWDESRRRVVVAKLEGDERAEIKDRPVMGTRPRMPAYVTVTPEGSEAEIRLNLSDLSDQRISDAAFRLEDVLRTYGVSSEDVIDLDERAAARAAPAGASATDR